MSLPMISTSFTGPPMHELNAAAAADREALSAAREAVARCRAPAAMTPARMTPTQMTQWAAALDRLVLCLRATGEHHEALEAAQASGLIKRELAAWGERLRPETLVPLAPRVPPGRGRT